MRLSPRVLLIGNVKEDGSRSMHLYFDFLKKTLSSENIDFLSLSSGMIPPRIFKNFIYPLRIPRGYDVYHILDHSYGHLVNFLPKNKTVITCHDLIPLKFPSIMSWRARILFDYYLAGMKKAKVIIAVSNSTRQDIKKMLNPKGKIKVVPTLSVEKREFSESRREIKKSLGLENKKVLMSVGNFFYKNTILILKAVKDLKGRYDNLLLVKIGGFSKEEEDFISENNLKDNVLVKKNISNEELNRYYNASDMLVFPSLYEGFGIPPLEAMACGTPVITSNVASLPEVVGDAAVKINPHSVEELKKAIIKIIENKKFRDSLVKKGFQNIKRFSIKEHAEKLEEIYKEVFESNNRNKNK